MRSPMPCVSSTSTRCLHRSASRSTSTWHFSSSPQASIGSWLAACVDIMTPRRAKSSATSSTCPRTSQSPKTKSPCVSTGALTCPSCSHRGSSINPSRYRGGARDLSASSNSARRPSMLGQLRSVEIQASLDFHGTEFASHDVPCKHHFYDISYSICYYFI